MRIDVCLVGLATVAVAWHLVMETPASAQRPQIDALPELVRVTAGDDISAAVTRAPEQAGLPGGPVSVSMEGYDFSLVSEFVVSARVLSRRRYRGDASSDISPLDLALGWGPMARADKASQLRVRQSRRFYIYSFPPGATLTTEMVSRNSANMHMVPADDDVAADLMRVREGDLVQIEGYLVDVSTESWRWTTSRTRSDTGAGACEIVLVRSVRAVPGSQV